MKPIAICQNLKMWNHPYARDNKFIKYCDENNINYEIVDPYQPVFIDNIDKYSNIIWTFTHYLKADLLEARNILRAAEIRGVEVFPNTNSTWHFDDKIAEMYAFKSIDAPIPNSWAFYNLDDTTDFLKNEANYPIIAKLRNGSGATNVKMIKNESEGLKYAKKMFTEGFDSSPSLAYKTYSKIQSIKNFKSLISRIKQIPGFLYARTKAKDISKENGYCYFQDFVNNDGFDLKIVVIGDKLTYLIRKVRKGDFRASGGGDFFYDQSYVTKNIIDSAFSAADQLGSQCMGFDYVVDRTTNKGLIIEMCYGFDYAAAEDSGGYFNRDGQWIDEKISIAKEVVDNMIMQMKS